MENKYVLFLDNISRTIFGKLVERDDFKVVVKNPAVLQLSQTPQGKLSVQLIPLVLRDLLKNPEEDVVWTYHRTQITELFNPVELNDKITQQYEFVANLTPEKAAMLQASAARTAPAPAPAPAPAQPVKLFREEVK